MMNREQEFFYIKICTFCGQDFAKVYRASGNGELYIYCEECMSEWNNPLLLDQYPPTTSKGKYKGEGRYATEEEIKEKGWKVEKGFNY